MTSQPQDRLPSTLPSTLPSVDVVIATHQRPELLRRAIAGVMAQTYQGTIRLLVVHDKSTPDTSLEEQHAGRSVEVLANTRTPGLAGARNSGIVTGTGDLVAFCDDDDEWRPDKLVRQVHQLEIDGAPTSVTGILVDYQDRQVVRVPTAADLTVATLARHRVMAAHPSSVVVRRAALDQIGLVDEEIPGSYGEDYDWILRAAGVGGFAVVPEPLVLVRWGGSQFNKQWSTIVAAIDHLLDKHPAFRADHRALGRLLGQRAFALAASGSPDAWRAARTTLRTSPRERRGYVAAAVAVHLVSAERVLDLAHKRGRGI
ncbi:glycosyltransferase family A protein [Nocardioides psychrotolerans]|uniref:glycosyltransferase family 2 protein n=1 Tax=Nocardioides psychrotolerans TaxID=1005945 RepID=UPI003137A11D